MAKHEIEIGPKLESVIRSIFGCLTEETEAPKKAPAKKRTSRKKKTVTQDEVRALANEAGDAHGVAAMRQAVKDAGLPAMKDMDDDQLAKAAEVLQKLIDNPPKEETQEPDDDVL